MTLGPERDKPEELAARLRMTEKASRLAAEDRPRGNGQEFKGSRLGFDFVATVLACIAVGWLLDWQLNTRPWSLLVLTLVGFVAGFWNLWKSLNAKG